MTSTTKTRGDKRQIKVAINEILLATCPIRFVCVSFQFGSWRLTHIFPFVCVLYRRAFYFLLLQKCLCCVYVGYCGSHGIPIAPFVRCAFSYREARDNLIWARMKIFTLLLQPGVRIHGFNVGWIMICLYAAKEVDGSELNAGVMDNNVLVACCDMGVMY
jgi:hypothetical protein